MNNSSINSKEDLCQLIDSLADNEVLILLSKMREFKYTGHLSLDKADFAASNTIRASSSVISFTRL